MDQTAMTPQRWEQTLGYIRELFCPEDAAMSAIMPRAVAAGLPEIEAGPHSGRVIQMLAMLTGARLAIEVGTLAGYSAVWLARGLAAGGRLISIDASGKHLSVARESLAAAGVANRVELRQGKGSEVLPRLLRELGPGAGDMIFLDAERSEYIPLLPTVKSMLRPGGVLVIDNALSAKRWVPDPYPPGEEPDQMDLVNRAVAADEAFVATVLPVGNGLLVGVRK
jgi:caffeoyl-CoA O-methyltransferase